MSQSPLRKTEGLLLVGANPGLGCQMEELSVSFGANDVNRAHSKLKTCSYAATVISYANSSPISFPPTPQKKKETNLLAMVWDQSATAWLLPCPLFRHHVLPRQPVRKRLCRGCGGCWWPRKGTGGREGWERVSREKSDACFGAGV